MKKSFFVLLSTLSFFCGINLPLFAVGTTPSPEQTAQLLDLKKMFGASPIIYTLLLLLSIAALVIWLYSLATFRPKEIMPKTFSDELQQMLSQENYDEAHAFCKSDGNILAGIVAVGLTTRKLGAQVMIDAMKSEGKRASSAFWQRLSLLNDIVIVAPMLGLLGTVIGMFYAFYDVNRSIESINALFDGLGIAVGTTVMGLVVAILAMICYTTLKYRLIKTLSLVENEAISLSALINTQRS